MRSMLLNMAGGLICAACLLAGLPVAATDLPEDEALVDPECMSSVIWKRQLGTPSFDEAIGVATDAAGNVLIGRSFVDDRFVQNVGVKYSAAGKRLRTRQLGWVGPYYESTMAWDSAGNFLIANSGGVDFYGLEYFVAKYSAAGTRLWTRQQYYGARDVATDAAGNVLVGGQTVDPGACCASEAFAAKYSPEGELLWTRTLAGWDYFDTDDVFANAVATDAIGNVFIAGSTSSRDGRLDFAFAAKYNADGKLLWTRKLALGDITRGSAVATDAAGNLVMVGGKFNEADQNAFVANYNPAGKLLWTRQFGTPEDDWASDVATDTAGNIVIGGTTRGSLGGPNQGSDDAFVAKYSPAGKRLWSRQFGTPEDDSASGVATDAAGNVVIEGTTRGSLGGPNHGEKDVFILELRP